MKYIDKINSEKGVALIAALLVLATLTMLGLSATLVSSTDVEIAKNEKLAMQGQYAAEAGVAMAIARLNLPSTNADKITPPNVTWSTSTIDNAVAEDWFSDFTGIIDLDGIDDGQGTIFTYDTKVSYKKVEIGGAYNGRVAFFNTTAGYSTAPSANGGWAVLVIESSASQGEYSTQTVVLELTSSEYNFQVKGGVTSGAGIDLGGSALIDPNFYDADGGLMDPQPVGSDPACKSANLADAKPGIYANGVSTGTADGGNKGVTTSANGEAASVVAADVPTSPWGAMGINQNSGALDIMPDPGTYFDDLFTPEVYTGGTPTGYKYYTNSCSALDGNGTGILVVHNPLFVPGACADGVFDGNPAECAAANAPAVLSKGGGNATFKGIIIADQVNFQGGGTIVITGSLISLSSVTTTGWNGTLTIQYSCQAIETYAGGKTNKKLNWKKE